MKIKKQIRAFDGTVLSEEVVRLDSLPSELLESLDLYGEAGRTLWVSGVTTWYFPSPGETCRTVMDGARAELERRGWT